VHTYARATIRYGLATTIGVVLFAVLTGCTTTVTHTRQTPIYATKTQEYTEEVSETAGPIVAGGYHKIAFTRLAGADTPVVEAVAENIKLGFDRQNKSGGGHGVSLEFVPRAQLLVYLTRSELENMGPTTVEALKSRLGVNVVCTGTILSTSPPKLSVEVLDLRTNAVISDVFSADDWQSVGAEVAQAFFGYRTVKRTITKYREVEDKGKVLRTEETEYETQETDWFSTILVVGGGVLLIYLIGAGGS